MAKAFKVNGVNVYTEQNYQETRYNYFNEADKQWHPFLPYTERELGSMKTAAIMEMCDIFEIGFCTLVGFGLPSPAAGPAIMRTVGATKLLSLGSTGRTVANNLVEQTAMKNVMENPQLGRRIMEGLTDSHWPGWTKMEYKVKTAEGVNAVIHYVAKWENGILKAVDDFKFK